MTVPPLPQTEEQINAYARELLTTGDVREIETLVSQLAHVLAGPFGRTMEANDPDEFGRWTQVLDRMQAAVDGGHDDAIRRLLRSFEGKPQLAVDTLAALPQYGLATTAEVGVGEEILRRLEEVDMVSKWDRGWRLTGIGRRWVSK